VWCKFKKGDEEIRSFELSRKDFFSNYDETNSKVVETKKNRSKKVHVTSRSYFTGHGGSKASKRAVSEDHASCWAHKNLTVTTKRIRALLTAARASGGKNECQVRLAGIEREYCMGTETGRSGGSGFRGTITPGDGSKQKGGKMGAGYV